MDSPSVSSDTNTPNRKRPRENETPSQRLKREKAAERQRRKRERDRNAANMGILSYPGPPADQQQQQHQQQQPQAVQAISHQVGSPSQGPSTAFAGQELTQEELARRERVRAAARERQRKHRQLVKQRKMRELGLDMGNEMMAGMEEYRVPPPDGHFHQVLPPELQPHPPPMGHDQPPPFPQGQLSGGRLFASTLLLSFSCDPLLKQHLMRTLHMTHEELASLEPVIADAWEHWDHQRRMHYEKQAVVAASDGSAGVPGAAPNGPHPYPPPPPANGDPSHNEFRARFRSSIEVPPPFPTYPPNSRVDPAISTATAGSSGPASVASNDPIDPHLTGQPSTSPDGVKATPNDMASKAIDPNLAQGKNET
ncbi:hypothetical protein AX14_004521 [Amanita brunnescens Koide BX004]|nr:hypothetical protein AX14_004521 [Amanita brunnescens Koide BX004]